MDRGHPPLLAWLRDRIAQRGPLPFVEFMEAALYHPEHGYYCRPAATTGARGDFYTSPDVHPAFGRLLARQIAELADRTRPAGGGRFDIVEMGPGTGTLARDVAAGLARERPDLAARTVYTMVEVSPSLGRLQRVRLGGGAAGALAGFEWARWDDVLARAARAPGFHGCVLAHEFLDALPVHLVQAAGGALEEVHVTVEGEALREVLLDPVTPRLAEHLDGLGVVLEEGQRAEVGLRAIDWISSLEGLFGPRAGGRGGALLIDYGHPARELYDPIRHRGTLLCYHRHRAGEDPYARVGLQDITAHVEFTSVERRARAAGLDAAPLTTQMRFLVSLGLARMLADLGAAAGAAGTARDRLALHALMAPGGMGEVFKVLLLARGTPAAGLTGATDPFRDPGLISAWGEAVEAAP